MYKALSLLAIVIVIYLCSCVQWLRIFIQVYCIDKNIVVL